jgi:spoIIIJ-associated protein
MSVAEGTGRTIDEAITDALQRLGAAREAVTVEVLQEPRPALLGFGGREARVKVTLRTGLSDVAQSFVEGILQRMGYSATVKAEERPDGIAVAIEGKELSALIGRHGRTLDALEVLLAVHLHREAGRRVLVVADAVGYRERRAQAIIAKALQATKRAVTEGVPVALPPMDPRDRRTVHLALKDDERVTTISEGEGDLRHVVIVPRPSGTPADRPADQE